MNPTQDTQEDDEVKVVQIDPTTTISAEEARTVDVQITTAKKYPRNMLKAINDAVGLVTLDQESAATCHYALRRGTKSITGPTVHMAKMIAQLWGNMRLQAKVVAIDEKHVTSQSIAWDLESNLAISIEIKRSIVDRNGVRYSDDMITVTGNAANSISLRNAILAVVPKAAVDKVSRAAKNKLTGDISNQANLLAKRKEIVDKLKGVYNVTDQQILDAVGKASMELIGSDEIIILIGLGQAIADGDTTVKEAFQGGSVAQPPKTKKQKEDERLIGLINQTKSLAKLHELEKEVTPETKEAFEKKKAELMGA